MRRVNDGFLCPFWPVRTVNVISQDINDSTPAFHCVFPGLRLERNHRDN